MSPYVFVQFISQRYLLHMTKMQKFTYNFHAFYHWITFHLYHTPL
jgi:hypothetical protein